MSILEADSLSELKREIKSFEKTRAEEANSQYEQQMKLQQDSQAYARETMLMREKEITEREIAKAKINVWSNQEDIDMDDNGIADFIQVQELQMKLKDQTKKHQIEDEKLKLKEKEVAIKKQIADKPTPKSGK
jgi:hypothetical protein